uniref:Uncharacterized protein n=1 Tax=Salix viminalis TaxID=40686 RepID=A0A6N2LAD7_SALVM
MAATKTEPKEESHRVSKIKRKTEIMDSKKITLVLMVVVVFVATTAHFTLAVRQFPPLLTSNILLQRWKQRAGLSPQWRLLHIPADELLRKLWMPISSRGLLWIRVAMGAEEEDDERSG